MKCGLALMTGCTAVEIASGVVRPVSIARRRMTSGRSKMKFISQGSSLSFGKTKGKFQRRNWASHNEWPWPKSLTNWPSLFRICKWIHTDDIWGENQAACCGTGALWWTAEGARLADIDDDSELARGGRAIYGNIHRRWLSVVPLPGRCRDRSIPIWLPTWRPGKLQMCMGVACEWCDRAEAPLMSASIVSLLAWSHEISSPGVHQNGS